MRILHYFLGFPPYRTGGLTKYAYDLMCSQAEDGNKVIALWPGQIHMICCKTSIKKMQAIKGVDNYELINPLPIPLDEGIVDVNAYMKACDIKIYESFFRTVKPDVIHIHTLMGLHKEFIDVANRLKIRMVFTTHDYFGICSKVTLYKHGQACEDDHCCKDCVQCNSSALSLKKIMFMQSPLYREVKNAPIIKQLRKHHRESYFVNEELAQKPIEKSSIDAIAERYKSLRAYYIYMLEHIDFIHFNSSVAERIYRKYITPKESDVVTITHKNITDNRNKCKWQPAERLRITSLAPAKPFKGFCVLQAALDELWKNGNHNYELKLFSPVQHPRPYMVVKEEGFNYGELVHIFEETDVLVAPSIWYETFGFTVLEALSYGVPVIISDRVGAKDIVDSGGIIVEAGNVQAWKEVIEKLDMQKLFRLRKRVVQMKPPKTWLQLVNETYAIYRGK